jgi:hypothetical protein
VVAAPASVLMKDRREVFIGAGGGAYSLFTGKAPVKNFQPNS